MSDKPVGYAAEVRDSVVKSSLSGVAATVLAVAAFSPAGLGGVIGTSLASANGGSGATDDAYATLPAFPAPLTQAELDDINSKLARTAAALEFTRAATDGKIEYIRSLSLSDATVTFGQVAQAAQVTAPVERVAISAPSQAPASFIEAPDVHLELAALLLAHENL